MKSNNIFNQNYIGEKIILVFSSILLITIFSTCSPLYPINPWDDANVFMTIGKSLCSGKLMYHDVIDHKGPVFYLLHQLSATISYTSFWGVYMIECVSIFFFMNYGLKIMRLFCCTNICLPLMLIMTFITVTSDFFYYGDSVEEFSLPLLAYALFYMLTYIKSGNFPSRTQAFVIGIEAALVFWSKFNITLFYVGGFIAMSIVAYKRREFMRLLKMVLWIITGFILVTIAIILYFAYHHTLYDFYQTYFYTNLFVYNGVSSNGEPTVWWFPVLKISIWAILMLPVLSTKVRWEIKSLVVLTYGIILFTYATLTVQLYYFVLIFAFSPLIIYFFRNIKFGKKMAAVMVFIVFWQTIFNWNIVTLVMGTLPTKVLQMTKIVNSNHTEDSRILTFSSYDTGIYLKSHQLPPNSHFFIPNYKSEVIKKEQEWWVTSGKVKYLVRLTGVVKTTHDYYDAQIPTNYKLIYDGVDNYRYRFVMTPSKYLWNLVWTRPIMTTLNIIPDVEPQHVLLYERRP